MGQQARQPILSQRPSEARQSDPGGVPDWWTAAFKERQARLRDALLRKLAKAGKPVPVNLLITSTYFTREWKHALNVLIADRRVRQVDQLKPISCTSTVLKTFVCYELVPPANGG